MASVFIEGFDKYGPAGIRVPTLSFTLLSEWTATTLNNGSIAIVSGLSSAGPNAYALQFTAGNPASPFITKQLPTTIARCIGGFRFKSDLNSTAITCFWQMNQATVAQWALTLNPSTGLWSLRTGGTGGTVLATASVAIVANSVHYLEFDITVGAAGAYTVYMDGVVLFTGTGNTRGDGANNFANGFQLGQTGGVFTGFSVVAFDDLYLFDGTGSFCNAPCLNSPVVETKYPSSDVQTQFTNGFNVVGGSGSDARGGDYSTNAATNAPGANELFLVKVIPPTTVSLASVKVFPGATSTTAKFKGVVYHDSGGSPNGQALIATGNEVVGATNGVTVTSTFASPPTLTGGTAYWIGFITDTSVALQEVDTSTNGVKVANTYASGAPATCPTVTVGQNTWMIWSECTGSTTNWVSEVQDPHAGDLSYIFSSTVSNEDLYGIPALSSTPVTIYTVAVKASAERTDTGARTISLRAKSNTTDSGGSLTGQGLPANYQWIGSYFDTDPDTAGAWGAAALTAASFGIKVDS